MEDHVSSSDSEPCVVDSFDNDLAWIMNISETDS